MKIKKLSLLKLSVTEQSRLYGGNMAPGECNNTCRNSNCKCTSTLGMSNSHLTPSDANEESKISRNKSVYSNKNYPDTGYAPE